MVPRGRCQSVDALPTSWHHRWLGHEGKCSLPGGLSDQEPSPDYTGESRIDHRKGVSIIRQHRKRAMEPERTHTAVLVGGQSGGAAGCSAPHFSSGPEWSAVAIVVWLF